MRSLRSLDTKLSAPAISTAWLVEVLRGTTKPRSMLHKKANLKTAGEQAPSGALHPSTTMTKVTYRDH